MSTPPTVTLQFPAFKEWSVIVEALGQGEQILILRKGGIAEGRSGFQVSHERFWLFPTQFHQQLARTKPGADRFLREPEGGSIGIRFFADLTDSIYIAELAAAERLRAHHLWIDEVVSERFEYSGETGLHCLLVRVFRLDSVHRLPSDPAYDGCKSWIHLPLDWSLVKGAPVLSDEEYARRRKDILAALEK